MLNDKVINNLNNLEIKDFLIKSNTIICQNINNKKQLFTNLANISKDTFNITNKDFIEFLYKKESSENSGIGNGVAIPNIQNTKIDYLSSIFNFALSNLRFIKFSSSAFKASNVASALGFLLSYSGSCC